MSPQPVMTRSASRPPSSPRCSPRAAPPAIQATGARGPGHRRCQASAARPEPPPISNRAKLLFEDAIKAVEAQKKGRAATTPSLERKFKAVAGGGPELRRGRLQPRRHRRAPGQARRGLRALPGRPEEEAVAEAGGRGAGPPHPRPGDMPSAIAQWNDVARAFPDDAESRARLAEIYRQTSDHDRAKELSRAALMREPKNLDAYKMMIRSNLDRKQLAMSKLVALRALKISTTDPDLYLAIGHVQLAKGEADKAAAQFQKALEANAGFVPGADGPGPARAPGRGLPRRRGAPAPARSRIGGERGGPSGPGRGLQGLGQLDKAHAEYDDAEKLQPKLAAIYLNRGIVLQRIQGRAGRVVELYKQYIALSGGESALPHDAPVFALLREAEAMVAAKSQARVQEQQAKKLEQAQQLQQQRLKAAEERTPAEGNAREGPAAATPPKAGSGQAVGTCGRQMRRKEGEPGRHFGVAVPTVGDRCDSNAGRIGPAVVERPRWGGTARRRVWMLMLVLMPWIAAAQDKAASSSAEAGGGARHRSAARSSTSRTTPSRATSPSPTASTSRRARRSSTPTSSASARIPGQGDAVGGRAVAANSREPSAARVV